ncbi:MAG: hypothetical protein H6822_17135 [Planctomycetaceae bacterium]|nr:hypothetical protein [Planctomycetales bacterium]MCB9923910.1 hypothetical protein [Planctomycetaceae bacterium]
MSPRFSGGEEMPELAGYRPLSPLAVVTCVAALASLLAIVHPLLWVIPVITIVLAVCTILRLTTNQTRYTGRNAAIAALCFASFVGVYAPAHILSRESALNREAEAKVRAWISLLQQGRIQEAHQLSLDVSDRLEGPANLNDHYSGDESNDSDSGSMMGGRPSPLEALQQFTAQPVVAKLLEFGEESQIIHLGNVVTSKDYNGIKITQRYRATRPASGASDGFDFTVQATRKGDAKITNWSVAALKILD